MRVVGVDGWRKGWVGIVLVGGRFCRAFVAEGFAGVMEQAADVQVVAVDMPVGLLEDEPRRCDAEARARLGARRSAVFPAPPRSVLERPTYAEALAWARQRTGKGVSRQAYGLRRGILEVDAFAGDDRVVEVHPEVSFAALASHVLAPKKTWAGQMERRRLLQRIGLRLPQDLGSASCVPPDDVLDAAVAAWTGHRVAKGLARPLPEPPTQRDPRTGRSIAIWC